MKKLFALFSAVLLTLAGCSEMDEAVLDKGTVEDVIQVTLGNQDQTRVAFQDDLSMVWSTGDKLHVYNTSGTKVTYNLTAGGGSQTGTFAATTPSGFVPAATFLSPTAPTRTSASDYTLSLPTTYAYSATTHPIVMQGRISEGKATLKHLTGFLKVIFYDVPAAADMLTVTTDKPIAGDFTVDPTATAPILTAAASNTAAANKSFTYTFSNSAASTDMEFIVPLPVGSYSKVEVTLFSGATELSSIEFANRTIERSMVYPAELTYNEVEIVLPDEERAKDPLTLEAIEAGTITITNPQTLTIEYSKDKTNWTSSSAKPIEISVSAGEKVYLRGDNAAYGRGSMLTNINCSSPCYVYGNIMSLISKDSYSTLKELTMSEAFYALFKNNTNLRNHPGKTLLLPATTLTSSCYREMFYGCTGLTSAPSLPATTLGESAMCYGSMFEGCTGLTSAPSLPATTLGWGCYTRMFKYCKGLTSAPSLPATTLEGECYYLMFQECTGLTSAPSLPATTLASSCYYGMFEGCTGLTSAPSLPATTLTPSCYCYMFEGCTGLSSAPSLPATTLASRCYLGMFQECSNLSSVKCLATDISATDCTKYWLSGVKSTGTFTKASGMTGWSAGDSGIPSGWTVVEE